MLVPGMGGHPEFHQPLIDQLSTAVRVLSSAHGDAETEPFDTLDQHVAYWEGVLKQVPGDSVTIVGISFGAHIALRLVERAPQRLARLCLISWPLIYSIERSVLRLLHSMPTKAAASLLGRSIFLWSELNAPDVDDLRRLRRELYDSKSRAARRLLSRITSLRSQQDPETLIRHNQRVPMILVYGRAELFYRMHAKSIHRLGDLVDELAIAIVDGDHSVAIRDDREVTPLVRLLVDHL